MSTWLGRMKMYKLISVKGNPKLKKSNKLQETYWNVVMHLNPINTKICPYQDIAGCKTACLNTAGRGGIFRKGETTNVIQDARQRKTELYLNDRETFMAALIKDIHTFVRACDRKGKKPAIRLNGTSDIQWETIKVEGHDNIFAMFPQIQFYDYTKIPTRKVDHIPNYHLTWSYSEANLKYSELIKKIISNNIAVVFRDALPKMFRGLKVIDGDKHDMRFLDKSGVVVGLIEKGKAKKDTSGFVINNNILARAI
jgi:hypothetical protein